MKSRPKEQEYSDEEAEKRANAAMRRALTTPYKPQKELKLGKFGKSPRQKRSAKTIKKNPKSS